MRRDKVIGLLRAHESDLRRFNVESLSVFGSTARDEARDDSDIDVLVKFKGPTTFNDFMGLKLYLEQLLGHRVDLVTHRALRPRLRPSVERDLVHVA